MIHRTVDVLFAAAATYGPAVLFVVFLLEGAVVGKIIPTRTLFVAVTLAAGASLVGLATVVAAAVAGATVGQYLLFLAVRRTDFDDADRFGPDPSGRTDRWLRRWGLSVIAVSNALPIVRGSLTVPTALSRVSGRRFSAYSLIGSTVYAAGLAALAAGLNGAVSALV